MKKNTKQHILNSARKLFVKHGFAGTSMGKIAQLANVNHSLLFHHFDNKEKLWLAVKQNIVARAEQQTKILPDTTLLFSNFLRKIITQGIYFYRKNSDIVRMLNWQRLEGDSKQKIGVTLSSDAQAWIDAIKHYQQDGIIDNQLKPEFIVSLLLSIISSAALDPNIFISSKKNQEAYIVFCIKQLERSLAKKP